MIKYLFLCQYIQELTKSSQVQIPRSQPFCNEMLILRESSKRHYGACRSLKEWPSSFLWHYLHVYLAIFDLWKINDYNDEINYVELEYIEGTISKGAFTSILILTNEKRLIILIFTQILILFLFLHVFLHLRGRRGYLVISP